MLVHQTDSCMLNAATSPTACAVDDVAVMHAKL